MADTTFWDGSDHYLCDKELAQAFHIPVGYSDHSVGPEASILSIAYKAKVIEKHFTINKSLDGPDHLASSTPNELATEPHPSQ